MFKILPNSWREYPNLKVFNNSKYAPDAGQNLVDAFKARFPDSKTEQPLCVHLLPYILSPHDQIKFKTHIISKVLQLKALQEGGLDKTDSDAKTWGPKLMEFDGSDILAFSGPFHALALFISIEFAHYCMDVAGVKPMVLAFDRNGEPRISDKDQRKAIQWDLFVRDIERRILSPWTGAGMGIVGVGVGFFCHGY